MTKRIWIAAVVGALALPGCGKTDKKADASATATANSTASAKSGGSAAAASSGAPAPSGEELKASGPKDAPKTKLAKDAVNLEGAIANAPTIETQDGPPKDEADLSSGFMAATDEPPPDAPKAESIASLSEYESAGTAMDSSAPDRSDQPFAKWRRVEFAAYPNSITIRSAGVHAVGQGTWASLIVVTQDGNPITQSSLKQFTVRSKQGGTGAVEFSLDPNSGGLEKLKGEIVFSLAAAKQDASGKFQIVNELPAVVAQIRYGKLVEALPTYTSLLNGRVFRSGGVQVNGQPAVSIVEFQYNSQNDCLYTSYVDAVASGGRFDEGLGYEGCASVSGGELAFNVEAVCKYALNNEPSCKKHEETVNVKFTLYPYGIGLGGRIFRDPSAL